MSQDNECQTPLQLAWRLSADNPPDTKRSNERRLFHEQETGSPVTPFMTPPKYAIKADRYDFDKSVEPDKKKLRTPPSKSGLKNRSRRSARHKITFLENSESDTLRSELSSVHKTYLGIIQDKDKEIATLKDNMMTISNLFAEDMDSLNMQVNDIQHDLDITEEELTISQGKEKIWTGISLKLKFILDEIKKIGALPDDHKAWVDPMVEDIEIPEVSINIKDEFVPTAQTDNIDWTDEEYEEEVDIDWTDEEDEDIIGDYLDNETSGDHCANCGEMNDHVTCDCPMPRDLLNAMRIAAAGVNEDDSRMNVFIPRMEWHPVATAMYNYRPHSRAILEKSATTIQKAWQNHQTLKKEQLDRELDDFMYCRRPFNKWEWDSDGHHDEWAKVIQRVWRGHHLRKLLVAAAKDRFHQGYESRREEAYLAHNVFLMSAGYPFPAEKL